MYNEEQPFFSVIVPVYNVEKYLGQCVESILGQGFAEYELILIDDGSPDSSGDICDKYASLDPRINVIHKENGGLSSARNAGIKKAKGKYIFFIDSDDYLIDNDAFQGLYNLAQKTQADVIMYGIKKFFEEDGRYESDLDDIDVTKINFNKKNDALKYMIERNIYKADACVKIVKNEIVVRYGMTFKKGYLSEDMDWCGDLMIYADSFAYYNQQIYVYRLQRQGAITNTNSGKLVEDKLYMCAKGLKQVESIEDEHLKSVLGSYYAYEYAVCLGISYNIKDKELLKKIKEVAEILRFDINNKVKKVNCLKSIIGFNLTRYALGAFVRLKN